MPNNKKILCLGNCTEDTDKKTKDLAHKNAEVYHGLLSTNDTELKFGYYQTSIYDWSRVDFLAIIEKFDELIILDQKKSTYNDDHGYYETIAISKHFSQSKKVTFMDQSLTNDIADAVRTNKSFCLLPFIQSVRYNNENYLCCYGYSVPVSKFDSTIPFDQDPNRNKIKQKLINGELVPNYCKICYDMEHKGVDSPRIAETIEWARRLDIDNIESAQAIKKPVYYGVRPSNKCNLMCRMCSPDSSSLIEKENKKLRIFPERSITYNNFDHVDINNMQRLYVTGGEPSISIELHKFLEKCIRLGKTNVEIIVNTNCVKLSQKFKNLIKHFDNLRFEVSVDGFEMVNKYVRWPTDWPTLIKNIDYLYENNFPIAFNTVVSIYTITCLDKTIDFLTNRYPQALFHITTVLSKDDMLTPYNFPNRKLAVEILDNVKQTSAYKGNLAVRSKIDEYYKWFLADPLIDIDKLRKFFEFNDLLDKSRGVKLIDYIPELEKCRNYLTKP